jgi:putative two-component system response regulator
MAKEGVRTHGSDDRRPVLLIVEDEAALRELVRVSLGDEFDYLEAGDGRTALELAAAHRPSLVLLDLMLPGVTGLDVLAALRADDELAEIPVVGVSAWVHLEPEAIAAGADRFVTKPFDPDELRATVVELLDAR